jgi:hypothetical protein
MGGFAGQLMAPIEELANAHLLVMELLSALVPLVTSEERS